MDFWEIEFRGSYPFSSSAGLPQTRSSTQKSIIICFALCAAKITKNHEITHDIRAFLPNNV